MSPGYSLFVPEESRSLCGRGSSVCVLSLGRMFRLLSVVLVARSWALGRRRRRHRREFCYVVSPLAILSNQVH